MKKEEGITMVSLVIYVVVMIMVIGMMNVIITNFYNNTSAVRGNVQEIVEFNKFNTYFLKEVKLYNNKVDKISNNYILFSSGNSFSKVNNSIYYNNIAICENVIDMKIMQGLNGDGIDKTIINVNLKFSGFEKNMNYKVENIY